MISSHNLNDHSASHLNPSTRFYTPKPDPAAIDQIAALTSIGQHADARLINQLISVPHAVWFTRGSPEDVENTVISTVQDAARQGLVPILVAYNLPFRDCAQFSAGGAGSSQEYLDWIDGFASGIGDKPALVILEPDSLGIIPYYRPQLSSDRSDAFEWCQPAGADPATVADERFLLLNQAVDRIKSHPRVHLYLDGTHSAWLDPSDAAKRLVRAGILRTDGFFLNVSNYQHTTNLVYYGTWIASAITYATWVKPGDYQSCLIQHWNAGLAINQETDLSEPSNCAALSPFGEWSDNSSDPHLNISGINSRFMDLLGPAKPATHFVIDTSRNGQGPWQAAPGVYPDAQDWCNPPGRGLGELPTANMSHPLLDACLWVKVPGESDGECTRGSGAAGKIVDPEWGVIDPPAGHWFSQMALDLARNSKSLLPDKT